MRLKNQTVGSGRKFFNFTGVLFYLSGSGAGLAIFAFAFTHHSSAGVGECKRPRVAFILSLVRFSLLLTALIVLSFRIIRALSPQ